MREKERIYGYDRINEVRFQGQRQREECEMLGRIRVIF